MDLLRAWAVGVGVGLIALLVLGAADPVVEGPFNVFLVVPTLAAAAAAAAHPEPQRRRPVRHLVAALGPVVFLSLLGWGLMVLVLDEPPPPEAATLVGPLAAGLAGVAAVWLVRRLVTTRRRP